VSATGGVGIMRKEKQKEKLKEEIERVVKGYTRVLGYSGTSEILEEIARSIREFGRKYL